MMNNSPFFTNKLPRSLPVYQNEVRSSPKVISVPVHFVSSEKLSKASAALKIQRLFRGFLVRKSVKKMASIRNEVGEIERRIDDIQVADLIRRDAKERLRVNETLMALLFKLDSIRGFEFDCGIRELRKAVTRKAIAIQEKVDSIANQTQTLDNDSSEIKTTSEQVTETSGSRNLQADAVEDDEYGRGIKEGVETNDLSEDGKDKASMEGDGGSREVMVKLMADNEKMMKLMMQISERNEMQTRMINSLGRRVEQLEKAFMAENLRRKKKTRVALRGRDGIDRGNVS